MKISAVSQQPYFNKTNTSKTKKTNNEVNFKSSYRQNFFNAIEKANRLQFSIKDSPLHNFNVLTETFHDLLKATLAFPDYYKTMYLKNSGLELWSSLKDLGPDRVLLYNSEQYKKIRTAINESPLMHIPLVRDNEAIYVGLFDMGRYKNSDRSQIFLEFNDPLNKRFIGFAEAKDQRLAFIKSSGFRYEFYTNNFPFTDSHPFYGYAIDNDPWDPDSYRDAIYDEKGNEIKPDNQSFWQFLLGL